MSKKNEKADLPAAEIITSMGNNPILSKAMKFRVRIIGRRGLLGSVSNNKQVWQGAKLAQVTRDVKDETQREEMRDRFALETDMIRVPDNSDQVKQVIDKQMTVFLRDENNNPMLAAHTFVGFFKSAIKACRCHKDSASANFKAYRTALAESVRVYPVGFDPKAKDYAWSCIKVNLPTDVDCSNMPTLSRFLRAETAMGPRVCISHSEVAPAGWWCEFDVFCMNKEAIPMIIEALSIGILHGTGQWRNAGWGQFVFEILNSKGEVILGNTDLDYMADAKQIETAEELNALIKIGVKKAGAKSTAPDKVAEEEEALV